MTAENRKRKDSTFPLGLMLNFCKQRKLFTLDISANPSQWSVEFERFTVTGSQSHPNTFQLNAYLDSLAGNIADSIGDYKRRKIPFTNAMLIERLFVVQKTTKLKSYIEGFIKDLDKQERFGHASTFSELLDYLEKFDKSLDKRLFADINYSYVVNFVNYQLKNGRKKGGMFSYMKGIKPMNR